MEDGGDQACRDIWFGALYYYSNGYQFDWNSWTKEGVCPIAGAWIARRSLCTLETKASG